LPCSKQKFVLGKVKTPSDRSKSRINPSPRIFVNTSPVRVFASYFSAHATSALRAKDIREWCANENFDPHALTNALRGKGILL